MVLDSSSEDVSLEDEVVAIATLCSHPIQLVLLAAPDSACSTDETLNSTHQHDGAAVAVEKLPSGVAVVDDSLMPAGANESTNKLPCKPLWVELVVWVFEALPTRRPILVDEFAVGDGLNGEAASELGVEG